MPTQHTHAPGNLQAHENNFHSSFITRCQALAERISSDPQEVTCPECINSVFFGEHEDEQQARISWEMESGQSSLF